MRKSTACAIGSFVIVAIVGCSPHPKSGKGFTLPVGDAAQGEATYVSLQCNACHKIAGVDQLAVEGQEPGISVALGGKVSRIKTYGELVTAVINPSHRVAKGYPAEDVSVDGKSKMTNYNGVMTVKQLTDLVTFLQSKYELREYEPTEYPML